MIWLICIIPDKQNRQHIKTQTQNRQHTKTQILTSKQTQQSEGGRVPNGSNIKEASKEDSEGKILLMKNKFVQG